MANKIFRVAGITVGTNSAATLYTVPTGLRLVIRKISVANKNSSSSFDSWGMCIGTYGTNYLVASHLQPGATTEPIYGPHTLEAGETITWTGTTNCYVAIDGELMVA